MSKEKVSGKTVEVENSIELRVVGYLMLAVTVWSYCLYSEAPIVVTIGCLTVSALGSYMSYVFRSRKSKIVNAMIYAGTFAVLGHFVFEAAKQFLGSGMFLPAFMQVLCGLLVILTFDLRNRTDVYVLVTVALGLMGTVASQMGGSINFGFFPLTFILFGAIFLYLISISHSREGAPSQVSASTRPVLPPALNQAQPLWKRPATGGALVAVVTLPVATFLIFCLLPRAGTSIIDLMADQARVLMARLYEQMHPPQSPAQTAMMPIPPRQQISPFSPPTNGGRSGPQTGTGNAGKGKPGQEKGGKGGNGKQGGSGTGSGDGEGGGDERRDMSGYHKPAGAKGASGAKGGQPGQAGEAGETGEGTGAPGQKGAQSGRPKPQMGLVQKRNAAEQDDILMHVTSTRPVYLRTLAFDTYEGQRWTNSKDQLWADAPKFDKDAYDITGVRSLKMPSNFRGSELEQRIEIKGPMDLGIPSGWIPQVVHFPNAIRVSTDGSLMSKSNLKEGIYYTVISMVPSADLSELRKAGMPSADQISEIRKGSRRFLQLPKDYDPQVKLLAQEIGGKDGNWFVRAERVSNYLKSNCSYLNNNNEIEPGLDSVAQFLLHSKTGACSMFASAEAILLRAQGIPARVVFGYLPGDKDPKSDVTYIRKKHEHAWAEVFIPTHGWVPIDPTPNGTLPVQPMQDASGGRRVFRSQRVEKAPAPSDPGQKSKDDKNPWAWSKKLNNPYMVAILIAILIFLIQDLARRAYAYLKARRNPVPASKEMKPSTALYMRLLKDLEKVSVSKTTSDTPSDVAQLVRTIASENAAFPATLREELPLLVDNFVEAYYLERFSNMEESVEEGNKLGQIGDKIHALVAEGTLTSAQRN